MSVRNPIFWIVLIGSFCCILMCSADIRSAHAQQTLDIRKPSLDKQGRFWIYHNVAKLFLPYGFMPPELADDKHMIMDAACEKDPHVEAPSPAAPKIDEKKDQDKQVDKEEKEKNTCISLTVKWISPYWCAVAFIAGPDKPPFWGEDDRGTYFDLSTLPKKKLVCWLKGETGTERVKLQCGILGSKGKYGDSLADPAETRWLKLSKGWQKFSLDLSKYSPKELSRITNGLTVVLSQTQQGDMNTPSTTIYLDTIYFE